MITVHAGVMDERRRIQVMTDVDCLSPSLSKYTNFSYSGQTDDEKIMSDLFWKWYEWLRLAEKLGFEVSIDFGYRAYETGGDIEYNH